MRSRRRSPCQQTEVSRAPLADEWVEDCWSISSRSKAPQCRAEGFALSCRLEWARTATTNRLWTSRQRGRHHPAWLTRDRAHRSYRHLCGNFPVRRERAACFYGRGSVDAKGPLATFRAAAAQAKISPDIRLICDRRDPKKNPRQSRRTPCHDAVNPEVCVIGEAVAVGSRHTRLQRENADFVEWRGDLGHSARAGGDGAELAFAYWAASPRLLGEVK